MTPQPRPRVVVVSVQGRAGLPPAGLSVLESVADVTFCARPDTSALGQEEAAVALADADVVALTPKTMPVLDDALLARLPRLKAVALHATGHDMLDPAVLARHGVALAVLPCYSTESVAEHAVAMLLTVARRVHLAHDRSRGLVPASTSLRGFELAGRTLGLVGTGRIGARVAEVATALGMRVVGHDPRPREVDGLLHLPLPDLLRASDAVVVACSRAHDAPPLLGDAELALLPRGAVLVVVSRAAVVDTGAALAAVRRGHLRGYAVDDVVVDPARDGDLLAEGRVVQTGHSAWWSDEVLVRGAAQWVQCLIRLVDGRLVDGRPVDLVAEAGPPPAALAPAAPLTVAA